VRRRAHTREHYEFCCDPWRVWYAFQRFLFNWVLLVACYWVVPYFHAMGSRVTELLPVACSRMVPATVLLSIAIVFAVAAFDYGVITIAMEAVDAASGL